MSSKVDSMLDDSMGKAQQTHGQSLSTFLASVTTSAAILGLGLITYAFLQLRFPGYYFQNPWQVSTLRWQAAWPALRQLIFPPRHYDPTLMAGLDNYFFDRYLHTLARIFLLLGLIVPPILIPLSVIDGRDEAGGVNGLDRLSFSNVGMSHTDRYWVHLGVAVIVAGIICYIIRHELQEYERIQDLSDVTIPRSLFVSSSAGKLSPRAIRRHLHKTAGGVSSITPSRNYSSLRAKIRRRSALLGKLELAETTLIMKANMNRRTQSQVHVRSEPLWMRYLEQKDRPSLLLRSIPWLPYFGARVDAIGYLRTETAQLNREIEYDQQHPEHFAQTSTSIVHFNERISMPLASIALKARTPPCWTLKHASTPSDTIWSHISISWWQQCVRTAVVYILMTGLVLGFAAPVTLVGSLSQLKYLAQAASWLVWIESLPRWLIAALQGVLPPGLLAAITAAVPGIIRLIINIEGSHSRQATENRVQICYFAFLFIQGFLIISLSAGITTTVGGLATAIQSLPVTLAQNLPKACNYFFSYLIMTTVTSLVSILIDAPRLFSLAVLSPLLDKTARQKWARVEMLGLHSWGLLIPTITNIACIGLIFSVIAPLILIFSCLYFTAIWLLYRTIPPKLSESTNGTGGLFFPTAMRQLLTGVYFLELCLTGLFFLVRNTENMATCTTQGIIMGVATSLTVLFHLSLERRLCISWTTFPSFFRPKQGTNQNKWIPETRPADHVPTHMHQVGLHRDEALSSCRPVVWLPMDELGLADEEFRNASGAYESRISCNNTDIDEHGTLRVWGPPPDSI